VATAAKAAAVTATTTATAAACLSRGSKQARSKRGCCQDRYHSSHHNAPFSP
jgi:hypothetical protein